MSVCNGIGLHAIQKVNCFTCSDELAEKKCKLCNKKSCDDCMDYSKVCITCKFASLKNKMACLAYLKTKINSQFISKPKFLFLPLIIKLPTRETKRSLLNALEHFYFCDKCCTVGDISETISCSNNHKKMTLYHNNKKYLVYKLREKYHRMLNGKLWYITNY